jgi:prepilin-type N-terminal cleavage/methylation domain-containing protein
MTRTAGFTMIELALVLTILGILVWVAWPSLEAYDAIRLDAAARRVAADLRYAQSRSMGTRRAHGVLFEPRRGRYTVFAPTPETPAADPASPGRPLRVEFAGDGGYRGVTIASASFGATPGVRFDYFGVPLDTAGAELRSPGRVVLSCRGRADTVEVSPGTGKVSVR